jgi:hypothetical protein
VWVRELALLRMQRNGARRRDARARTAGGTGLGLEARRLGALCERLDDARRGRGNARRVARRLGRSELAARANDAIVVSAACGACRVRCVRG